MSKINLEWKQVEKHNDTWESKFWPKNEAPFIFKIFPSGTTSRSWYTVMIYIGDNLLSRQDEPNIDKAKSACESFLKHMYYRERY